MSVTGQKYSKSDIIEAVASGVEGVSKRKVKEIVDAVFDEISAIMCENGTVTIQKFGRFFIKTAQSRSFRKINSDETITVEARPLPKMKYSKRLISRIKD